MRHTLAAICLVVFTTATSASQIGVLKTGTYSGVVTLPPHQDGGSQVLIWVDIQSVDQDGKVTAEAEMGAGGSLIAEMRALEGRVADKKFELKGEIILLNLPGGQAHPLVVEILNEPGHLKGKLNFTIGNAQPQHELWEFDARYLGNVIGEWQGVQETSERLELGADATLTLRDRAGKVRRGTYSCKLPKFSDQLAHALGIRGRSLQYQVLGETKSVFSLACLADPYMILQDPKTRRHLVYIRVQDGKVPPPSDVNGYQRLILGKWKALGQPPNELIEFRPNGKMVETGPANIQAQGPEQREYPGVYQIEEGVMEFSLVLPSGITDSLKTTIVELTDDELALLDQAKNRLTVYRRKK
jgi:hypothetical protein